MASKKATKSKKKKTSKKKPSKNKPAKKASKKKQPSKKKGAKKNASKKGMAIAPNVAGAIVIGSAVEFNGAVGRVCNIKASSTCCVQFTHGCIPVAKSKLVPTSKPAPPFNPACANC